MLSITVAAALALTTAPLPATQDPPASPAAQAVLDAPRTLEDIDVTGRPLERVIRQFVDEVAEPNRNRGLARWHRQICVGVVNLRPATAQYLVDRISTVAQDIGLEAGAPGCSPNILVIATDDARGLTRSLTQRRSTFRMGGAGMDRGNAAFRDFRESDRAVRWWQLSLPTDSETGDRAVRIPGDCQAPCSGPGSVSSFAPNITVFAASRIRTQIIDSLFRTIVVVDIDKISSLSGLQLADYIAMVSLAQIDPDADTSGFASILNVLDEPTTVGGLTDWDQAYLQGLYGAERNSTMRNQNRGEIVNSIARAHRTIRDQPAE